MLYLGEQMNLLVYAYFPHFLADVNEIQLADLCIMPLSKWEFYNFLKIDAGKAKLYWEV